MSKAGSHSMMKGKPNRPSARSHSPSARFFLSLRLRREYPSAARGRVAGSQQKSPSGNATDLNTRGNPPLELWSNSLANPRVASYLHSLTLVQEPNLAGGKTVTFPASPPVDRPAKRSVRL